MSRSVFAVLVMLQLSAHAEPPAPAAPLDFAAQQALFRQLGAMDHMHVYAIDDKCMAAKNVLDGSPHGTGTESLSIGKGPKTSNLTFQLMSGDTAAAFPGFKAWAEKRFARGDHRVAYGLNRMMGKDYGYRALCTRKTPVLESTDVGHIVNKLDPELDKKSYRMGVLATGLAKVRKLPASTLRLALVYDEDLLIANVDVDMLRAFEGKTAVLDLISLE